MRKIVTFTLATLASLGFVLSPNDCSTILIFIEGSQTTMTHYNSDNKVTGTTKTKYFQVERTDDGARVNALQENYDSKGKLSTATHYTIRCDGGILYFDLKTMIHDEHATAYKDFEMVLEGIEKEIPLELAVGNTLRDANVSMRFKTKDGTEMPMMKMNISVTNRKVEAKESITTPAGTFNCFKISEDVEIKTMFPIRTKSIHWFDPQIGTIRVESYDKNGTYVGKTEVTEIKK